MSRCLLPNLSNGGEDRLSLRPLHRIFGRLPSVAERLKLGLAERVRWGPFLRWVYRPYLEGRLLPPYFRTHGELAIPHMDELEAKEEDVERIADASDDCTAEWRHGWKG